VVSSNFGYVEGMKKLGIERRLFTAGENKGFLDPYLPIEAEQKAFWNNVLSITHRQFIEQVKLGRGDRLSDRPEIYSGYVWTGEQALELGLIDALGSASYVAREVVGAEKIVDYTVSPDPFDRIFKQIGMGAAESLAAIVGISDVNYRLR